MRAGPSTPAAPWLTWVRRHERLLAVLVLGAVAALAGLLALPPTRARALDTLQAAADRWDRRWDTRLAHGAALVAGERYGEAAAYLERLDGIFPAPSVQHARDKQREQLLRLLARSYEALGRNARTMATYDRLIAFDSLDYYNVYLKAAAAERLLSGWALAPEARDAYAAALRVFPNHLPSLRGVIRYHSDRGEFLPVVAAARAYLDATLLLPVTLTLGDTTLSVPVPVDGRPHALVIAVPRPHAESLVVRGPGTIVAVDRAGAVPALTVGGSVATGLVTIPATAFAWSGVTAAAHDAWRPLHEDAALRVALPRAPGGLAELRLVVRLFKPMDATLWAIVRRSYLNLLDAPGLAAADAQIAVFPRDDDADDVLRRLQWARAGIHSDDGEP